VSEIVLDASAVISMLTCERGADKVAAAISAARICTINYAEVVTHFVHLGMPERESTPCSILCL
jgi:PIN domain nuclease of toxin-antitoxin system